MDIKFVCVCYSCYTLLSAENICIYIYKYTHVYTYIQLYINVKGRKPIRYPYFEKFSGKIVIHASLVLTYISGNRLNSTLAIKIDMIHLYNNNIFVGFGQSNITNYITFASFISSSTANSVNSTYSYISKTIT